MLDRDTEHAACRQLFTSTEETLLNTHAPPHEKKLSNDIRAHRRLHAMFQST